MTTQHTDKSEVYISIDVEASGPIPGKYSMLSIGACVVGQPNKSFYAELKPLNMNFIPEALSVSCLSLDILAREGMLPQDAMRKLRVWIDDASLGNTPVFVGFNAVFDWSFINWYFHEFLGSNPFGFGGIDIKSYYMGTAGIPWSRTSSSQITSNYPIRQKQTHNALDDARSQAEMFERLFIDSQNRFNEGNE